jgi:hypothetical protein
LVAVEFQDGTKFNVGSQSSDPRKKYKVESRRVHDLRVLLNEAQSEMLDLCIKIPHAKQRTLAENVVDNSWSKFPFQDKEKICGVITEK